MLCSDKQGKHYIKVDLTKDVRKNHLKEAINLMLEIYGYCYIFDGDIQFDKTVKQRRCNWEILPPGKNPIDQVKRRLKETGVGTDTYEVYRLEQIGKYDYDEMVEGTNGFTGYYAYLFEKYCVFESAKYGNATYIVLRDDWEILSQKTKKVLFEEGKVENKIIHNSKWFQNITEVFKGYDIPRLKEGVHSEPDH